MSALLDSLASICTACTAWVLGLWWPYWVLLAVAFVLVMRTVIIALYRAPEYWAIGSFIGRRGAAGSWQAAREWLVAYRQRRELQHYSRRPATSVERQIEALNDAAEKQLRFAEILEYQAQQSGPGWGVMLRNRADKRRARRGDLIAKAEHIRALLAKVGAEKIIADQKRTRSKVVRLVGQLSSSFDHAATAALVELNKLGSSLDWDSFLPDTVPELVRVRLCKVLRQMAGTNSVGEARAAKNQAESMLEQCGASWEGIAA